MATLNNCEAFKYAKGLETMAYKSFVKVNNRDKKLFSDIVSDISNCCDAVTDAFYLPNDHIEEKSYALKCAYANMKRVERKLDVAVNSEINAITLETRAKYDIAIEKLDLNLRRWSNSLSKKYGGETIEKDILKGQISAVKPVGATEDYEDTLQGQIVEI